MDSGERHSVAPVLVLGVGNLIQCDDGVGVHAIQRLMQESCEDNPDLQASRGTRQTAFPAEVELFDGGTAGYDLLPVLANRKAVIVIDAVDANRKPGTLFRFTPDDIPPDFTGYDSIHQLGLMETLHMTTLQGNAPERAVIFGIQPGLIDWGDALSEPVAKVVPRVLELVRAEIDDALAALTEDTIVRT
ncbi:HyaD/HybD family hydrogenase maturation endopeptidase [bacterium]|nr:HyaD/HybD family hydrogenase maturation endopeptidase [bacterium]